MKQAITKGNYREVLVPLLTAGGGQGFCVNLSVDIMTMCRVIGALYIDTVVEPWLGLELRDGAAGMIVTAGTMAPEARVLRVAKTRSMKRAAR
jgi:homospermidine synthase